MAEMLIMDGTGSEYHVMAGLELEVVESLEELTELPVGTRVMLVSPRTLLILKRASTGEPAGLDWHVDHYDTGYTAAEIFDTGLPIFRVPEEARSAPDEQEETD